MMRYIGYAEYLRMDGECTSIAFARSIDRACSVIDNATHGRIKAMKEVPNSVKILCKMLIDYFASGYGSSAQISSQSQSANGVSESQSFAVRSTEERASEIDSIITDMLMGEVDDNGTPLLYRGCRD
jgi:glucose-6-phosphate dehydrogenase assembly protein OpcA